MLSEANRTPADVIRTPSQVQLRMSPYTGVDFSPLDGASVAIDPVSLADIYRNSFVYPPHSIYRNVKQATLGFDAAQDLHHAPEFRPPAELLDHSPRPDGRTLEDWLDGYHEKLCGAITRSCADLRAPWMLQSGGKDSTSLAIASAAVRPDVACLTYLGGREENEVDSARAVATRLGLRHEALTCDPARAYDRYLAALPTMPLITADFALLSYVDLLTEVGRMGGDGVIDGVGSDIYFGAPANRTLRLLTGLAGEWRLPARGVELLLRVGSFRLAYVLSTLQMHSFERFFPGTRFSDAEVDELLGKPLARASKQRLALFQRGIDSLDHVDDRRALSLVIADAAGGFPKGLYTAHALSMGIAHPFCDAQLLHWVRDVLPPALRMDAARGVNKVLVRAYIARHFQALPYVAHKGSFRFDLRGLAAARFEQVDAFAQATADLVPGARAWLQRNRRLLGNKSQASKFYLLAITLPWLAMHGRQHD